MKSCREDEKLNCAKIHHKTRKTNLWSNSYYIYHIYQKKKKNYTKFVLV